MLSRWRGGSNILSSRGGPPTRNTRGGLLRMKLISRKKQGTPPTLTQGWGGGGVASSAHSPPLPTYRARDVASSRIPLPTYPKPPVATLPYPPPVPNPAPRRTVTRSQELKGDTKNRNFQNDHFTRAPLHKAYVEPPPQNRSSTSATSAHRPELYVFRLSGPVRARGGGFIRCLSAPLYVAVRG